MTPYQQRREHGYYNPRSANYFGSIGTSELTPEPAVDPEPAPEPTPEPIAEAALEPEPERAAPADDEGDDPRATKKALELAAANGLDLAGIEGSGLHGRITVGDVDAALTSQGSF